MQRLLAGSGLSYRFTDATTVTLERTVAQEASPVPLAPVTMTGKLYVGVENLLNTKYVNRIRQGDNFDFNWYPEQGTRVSIGYTLRW